MARARNPRRLALEVIEALRSNAQTMKSRWSYVPSTRWRMDENGRFIHEPRARKDIPASEYRENDPEEWARLAQFMATIERQAADVRKFALRQEQEARSRLA